jgi:hypothetical protein
MKIKVVVKGIQHAEKNGTYILSGAKADNFLSKMTDLASRTIKLPAKIDGTDSTILVSEI